MFTSEPLTITGSIVLLFCYRLTVLYNCSYFPIRRFYHLHLLLVLFATILLLNYDLFSTRLCYELYNNLIQTIICTAKTFGNKKP